jgi:hypothetical protein
MRAFCYHILSLRFEMLLEAWILKSRILYIAGRLLPSF